MNSIFRRRSVSSLLLWTALVVPGLSAGANNGAFKEVYAVGDSLIDTGNLAAILGFESGMVLDPETGFPLGVVLQDGRLCDGALTIEKLADAFGSADGAKASAHGGNNYAIAGAVCNPDLGPYSPFSLPGTDLMEQVEALIDGKTFHKEDLVIVFIGSNDLFAALGAPQEIVPSALEVSVENVTQTLRGLQAQGVENFLVFGVGNIARTPVLKLQALAGQLPPGGLALARNLAIGFNRDLVAALIGLRLDRSFKANVWYFPTFAVGEYIASPAGAQATGLTSQTPCTPVLAFGQDCASSTFWDMVHLTTAVHEIFAKGAETLLALPPLVRR